VRLQAVEALADEGGEKARSVLREAMRDDEEEVRDAAAAGIPDAEGANALHRSDLGRSR
jgi:HEAT repeat protein